MRRLARRHPARPRPLALTTIVTPLLLLALAACGDPDTGPDIASADGGATPSASSTKGATEGDPVKFADCMRKYGIEVDVPQGGGQGPVRIKAGPGDETKMTEAQRECRQYAPSGGPGEGQPLSQADQEKFLKFAKCMRDHGIPMKDPDFSGGGVGMMIGEGPNGPKLDEGKVEAAHKACSSNLPEEMREGPGGGSGPQEAGAAGSDGGGS
jgi:hypothetical protein